MFQMPESAHFPCLEMQKDKHILCFKCQKVLTFRVWKCKRLNTFHVSNAGKWISTWKHIHSIGILYRSIFPVMRYHKKDTLNCADTTWKHIPSIGILYGNIPSFVIPTMQKDTTSYGDTTWKHIPPRYEIPYHAKGYSQLWRYNMETCITSIGILHGNIFPVMRYHAKGYYLL